MVDISEIKIGTLVRLTPEAIENFAGCTTDHPHFSRMLRGETESITLIMHPSVYIGRNHLLLALPPHDLTVISHCEDSWHRQWNSAYPSCPSCGKGQ